MRPFALMRRLSKAFRLLFRWVPQVWKRFDVDRLFKYRREYQVPESWQNSHPQLNPLEPRVVPASVQGWVWSDTNGNGAIDSGEPMESGIAVTLSGGDLVAAQTVTTNSLGKYSFGGLDAVAESYTLTFAEPSGYTYDNLGGSSTAEFTLNSGETTIIDGGLYTDSGGGDGGGGEDGSSGGCLPSQ